MRPHSIASAPRTGFSVVEVLIALVLLAVALMAVAAGESLAVRMSVAAARERRAAQRGADRIARLTTQGCASATSGTFTDPDSAFTERWTVAAPVNGAAMVDAQVNWATQ